MADITRPSYTCWIARPLTAVVARGGVCSFRRFATTTSALLAGRLQTAPRRRQQAPQATSSLLPSLSRCLAPPRPTARLARVPSRGLALARHGMLCRSRHRPSQWAAGATQRRTSHWEEEEEEEEEN
jgi:hypothetical protein